MWFCRSSVTDWSVPLVVGVVVEVEEVNELVVTSLVDSRRVLVWGLWGGVCVYVNECVCTRVYECKGVYVKLKKA